MPSRFKSGTTCLDTMDFSGTWFGVLATRAWLQKSVCFASINSQKLTQLDNAKLAEKWCSVLGWNGLFLRGLQTRIVSHGVNSMVFTVAWKLLQDNA